MFARTPELFHAALQVGVERAPGGEIALRGEHRLGRLGGKLPARLGSTRLHDHRPALDRPRDVERTACGQVFALVVEHMHLRRIEENATLHIADEGVVRPAVP